MSYEYMCVFCSLSCSSTHEEHTRNSCVHPMGTHTCVHPMGTHTCVSCVFLMGTLHSADWPFIGTYRIPRKGRNASKQNVENDSHAPHIDGKTVTVLFLDDFWRNISRRAAKSVETVKSQERVSQKAEHIL